MKIFTQFLDPISLNKKFENLKHIDFSLFIDKVPQLGELSTINILVLGEPNSYFGLSDYAIQNKNLFQAILTWDDKVLNNCENALFLPFGGTWLKPDQYEKYHEKKFEIAHLSGILNKCYGHNMRHEILAREKEFKVPTNFHKTIGDRSNLEDARLGKETVFGNSQYGIAIENFSHRGFFTEKLIDCFLMKTIPIYWGCSNIDDYFGGGMVYVKNVDDLIHQVNNLTPNLYKSASYIEANYQFALKYIDYEQNIFNKVEEIFNLNEL